MQSGLDNHKVNLKTEGRKICESVDQIKWHGVSMKSNQEKETLMTKVLLTVAH